MIMNEYNSTRYKCETIGCEYKDYVYWCPSDKNIIPVCKKCLRSTTRIQDETD